MTKEPPCKIGMEYKKTH